MSTPNNTDLVARRLVHAVQDDLRRWQAVPRLEPELVAALYLRVREILGRWPSPDDGAIDELALAVYLTTSAWQPTRDRAASLLPILRRDIAEAMHAATKITETKEGETS